MTDMKNGREKPVKAVESGMEEKKSAAENTAGETDAFWANLASGIPTPAEDVTAEGTKNTVQIQPASFAEAAAPLTVAGGEADSLSAGKGAGEAGFETASGGEAGVLEHAAMREGRAEGKKSGKKIPLPGPFGGKSMGPVLHAVPMTKDAEGGFSPTPPTAASRLFGVFALLPILLPLLLLTAQVAFTLDTRALWYSDEVRYADAYRNMGETGEWLVLELNGKTYPDKPPMFFWLLHGIREVAAKGAHLLPFSVTENVIFFAGTAFSGALCLLAAHLLASLVGRVDRRTVLAADLILVSSFFFAGLLHYLRMDLLFAALITFSHVFFFHALVRDKAPWLMAGAFLFAGSAVLVKGPLGLAFPLLAGVCFLIWQGRAARLFRADFFAGLVLGLAVPGAWLALAWMSAGPSFLDNILHKQVLARALNTWHHAEPWYHYLVTFPLIWLPWTLVLFFLPWRRFMGGEMRAGLNASRTGEAAGTAYLWCAFVPGFILLSAVSIKIPIYCLPLFPPLAVICARAVLRMSPFAAACLQYSLAGLLGLFGLCLLLLPVVPEHMMPLPHTPAGTMILGGVCFVFACALAFLVKPRRGEGLLLLVALFTTVFAYPVWSVTAPSLDAFLSPKAQAEIVKTYKDAGYAVATYKVYPGTHTYYAGNTIDCETFAEALAVAEANPKTVLILRASFWDGLENRPQDFTVADRRRIAERDYVVAVRPNLGEPAQKPAAREAGAEEPAAVEKTPEALPQTGFAPEAASGELPAGNSASREGSPKNADEAITPGKALPFPENAEQVKDAVPAAGAPAGAGEPSPEKAEGGSGEGSVPDAPAVP